jgi:hypothetical protein
VTRRGRKRKAKPRHKNDRLKWKAESQPLDRGTIEMQKLRSATTGDQRLSPDYPLSILLGRGLIDSVQHDAGMKFARTYWALFGRPFARAQDYQQPRGTGLDAVSELRARRDHEAAVQALAALGAVGLITDLAVFLRRGWLVDAIVNGEKRQRRHLLRLDKIRQALDALAILPPVRLSREERDRVGAEMG